MKAIKYLFLVAMAVFIIAAFTSDYKEAFVLAFILALISFIGFMMSIYNVDKHTKNSNHTQYEKEIEDYIIDLENESNKLRKQDVSSNSDVIRTERGWAGHFIGANKCRFRRNTLLTYNDIKIVVSTVGLMELDGKFIQIGAGRYFETMAFHSNPKDTRYYDADVGKQVDFDSDWAISKQDADDKANEMHEAVVAEIITKLKQGYNF